MVLTTAVNCHFGQRRTVRGNSNTANSDIRRGVARDFCVWPGPSRYIAISSTEVVAVSANRHSDAALPALSAHGDGHRVTLKFIAAAALLGAFSTSRKPRAALSAIFTHGLGHRINLPLQLRLNFRCSSVKSEIRRGVVRDRCTIGLAVAQGSAPRFQQIAHRTRGCPRFCAWRLALR